MPGIFEELVKKNNAGLQMGPHRAQLTNVADQNPGAAAVTHAVRNAADHVEKIGRVMEQLLGINLGMAEPGMNSASVKLAREEDKSRSNDTFTLGV